MEFKDIQDQIKSGKPKEELAKSWASLLRDWKAAKKMAASSRASELEAQIKDLKSKLSAQSAELNGLKEGALKLSQELQQQKVESAKKTQELVKANEDLQRVRQEFVARAMEMERLVSELENAKKQTALTQENFLLKDRESSQRSAEVHKLEENYQQALVTNQSLLKTIEQKDSELAQAKASLARYESGELERSWGSHVKELEIKITELSGLVASKDKEFADFREFLKTREEAMSKTLEEQARQFVQDREKLLEEKDSLLETIKGNQDQIKELERELASFRRLLRKEEERSRALEEQSQNLDRIRKDLEAKLSAFGVEIKDYTTRLARYFEGLGGSAPAAVAAPQALMDLPASPTPSLTQQSVEEISLEEELFKLENEGGSLDIDLGIEPEEPL